MFFQKIGKTALICCQNTWQHARAWALQHAEALGLLGDQSIEIITLAGADRVLATFESLLETNYAVEIHWRVKKIAIDGHDCNSVVLFGHSGCLGNPVIDSQHTEYIREGVRNIQGWDRSIKVFGVFVREQPQGVWRSEEICVPELWHQPKP